MPWRLQQRSALVGNGCEGEGEGEGEGSEGWPDSEENAPDAPVPSLASAAGAHRPARPLSHCQSDTVGLRLHPYCTQSKSCIRDRPGLT